jgi:hypothetical protein
MKVVCVDDRRAANWRQQYIRRGNVYVIASVGGAEPHDPDKLFSESYVTVTLVGIKKSGHFASLRFRPAVEHKTDISVFKALLNPTPEKIFDTVVSDTLADIYLSARETSVTFTHPVDPPK